MNKPNFFRYTLISAISIFTLGCIPNQDPENDIVVPTPSPADSKILTGKFLHLSDIHFNVFTSTNFAQLKTEPVEDWYKYFDASASPSSGGGTDTNYALLMSTLNAAKEAGPYDYILYTGDYLPHGFSYDGSEAEAAEFAAKIVEFINHEISKKIKDTPIVGMLGNNDGGCGDYSLHPDGKFLADLAPDMPGLKTGSDAQSDFKSGGYYTIPHPTVSGTDFVVLSTFWSHNFPGTENGFSSKCILKLDGEDPGQDQVNFLNSELSPSTSPSPRNAILLMHIPPGIDGHGGNHQWHRRYDHPFKNAVTTASDKVLGAFAGHTHMDEFRVFSDSTGPYLSVRIAPSVTTYNGNQPAFTVADYDTTSGAMTDYEVHSYRYNSENAGNAWQREYRFSSAFGVSSFSKANLAKIASSLQKSDDPLNVREPYLRFYQSNDSEYTSWRRKRVLCATTARHEQAFNSCVENLN